jgi:hypothetical protein
MSFVDIHDRAMAIVDRAREAQRTGDKKSCVELLRTAYRLEQQAARSLEPVPESEPTRTVLFRSASSLAFQAEDYHEACSLAFDGLSGNSPEEQAAELLEIATDAKFRIQLIGQNLQVPNNEITLTLRGPHVSVGLAPAKQATLILQRLERLLRARVEDVFKNKLEAASVVSPTGSPKLYDVFMRPVAAEEFAVAFQLGLHEQLSLFGTVSPGDQIIADFMRDLQTIINSPAKAKDERFSAAVLRLEPDGKEVTSIEISSMVSGELISVRIPPRKGPASAPGEAEGEDASLG